MIEKGCPLAIDLVFPTPQCVGIWCGVDRRDTSQGGRGTQTHISHDGRALFLEKRGNWGLIWRFVMELELNK